MWPAERPDVPDLALRFPDDRTVEIVGAAGCTLRSRIDPVTLDVDPVHRPGRPEGDV